MVSELMDSKLDNQEKLFEEAEVYSKPEERLVIWLQVFNV